MARTRAAADASLSYLRGPGPARSDGGAEPPGPGARHRWRLAIFGAVCAVAAGATVVAVLHGGEGARPGTARPPTLPHMAVPSRGLTAGSYLLFRSTTLDREYGRLELADVGDPAGPRAVTPLTCDRVDFAAGRGLCLSRPKVGGVVNSVAAIVFDAHFTPQHTVALTGLPSRARVSPDGRFGAVTTFVTGDSYATMGTFSTRTDIIDLGAGRVLFDLEKLHVANAGKPFQATDFNFWGVTFTNDGAHFYATLATGGHTDLIRGDIASRTATVVMSNAECPSLSPDNLRIAFKRRLPGATVKWRLSVVDLSDLRVHSLAETRSVDDQVAWLNDGTVMYGVPDDATENAALNSANPGPPAISTGASLATDTWVVPADGSGVPRRLNTGSWSTVAVGS